MGGVIRDRGFRLDGVVSVDGLPVPDGPAPGASIYIPVSHDLLVDSDLYGQHVCDESCPPPFVLPPVPWQMRIRFAVRQLRWRIRRIPGYRLVHKDELGREE